MQTSSLQILIDLACKEVNTAAEVFAQANAALLDSKNKLSMLIGYRQDYINQFTEHAKTGIGQQEYQNFQRFIIKLDEAIAGQEAVVNTQFHHAESCKKAWHASQRKKMSFDVLMGNEEKKAHRAVLKKEQKQMDEHASRVSRNQHRQ